MLQYYTPSLTEYKRLITREVRIGDLILGNGHPIRTQTMTTTDTMDTEATVAQTIRCIEAGAELVRITAPSKKEAENLLEIKRRLRAAGFNTPLVADIHFTPNAAEVAAGIVEKVRVNPGNYADKKKFDFINYSETEYSAEIQRIRDRFLPLVKLCKQHGTAMRIGTNHGSLSDRIMSRYGDSPMGMVESALEFLRIARDENYHQIVLSMKSSNPQVMVQAYRLLVRQMQEEFGECYPLHLGVTEAGDGEDGRIKSALGIGSLLEDGIGDTIRVSLTEDPEFEIPVCQDIIAKYAHVRHAAFENPPLQALPYDPFSYRRRMTTAVENIGGTQVPVVIADLSKAGELSAESLASIGYAYDEVTDKWNLSDAAADYIYTGNKIPDFALPGTLRVIALEEAYCKAKDPHKVLPIFDIADYERFPRSEHINFVMLDCFSEAAPDMDLLHKVAGDRTAVFCLSSTAPNAMQRMRNMCCLFLREGILSPVILISDTSEATPDRHLVKFSSDVGPLLLDGFGDGICLGYGPGASMDNMRTKGRTYLAVNDLNQFANNTAFSILQAARTRISKTEYISCPSCGRTLFDLQETTAKIREATHHLKGVKIAIMGCIVNGPGEMADADFGYVGSGPGKITLYKNKDVVKKNVPDDIAVAELIQLLKDNGVWVDR